MKLRPFFGYFGSKWRTIVRYPVPRHEIIVEPFAGSASYALHYPDRQVLLVDLYPTIANLWRYLITADPQRVLSLPDTTNVQSCPGLCDAEKTLIGFWFVKASATPRSSSSSWMVRHSNGDAKFWGRAVRERIAAQLEHIRHWVVVNASYDTIPNGRATWFVDPPYEHVRRAYRYHAVDYPALARWCCTRRGQVIVCESQSARWLPFAPLGTFKSQTKRGSREAICHWNNNEPT